MKFSLYEIDQMILEAIDAINSEAEKNEGVYSDQWQEILDGLQMDRKEKLLNTAKYIKSIEAMAEAVYNEKKALNDRQRALENRAEYLRSYIARSMMDDKEISDATTRLSWRSSEAVVINSEAELPEYMFRVKREPVLTDIKAALKNGEKFNGVELVARRNLQIK